MLREKRLQVIMDLLNKDGSVQNSALCDLLDVSDITIRRDLDTLAASNKIIRTHGGAIINAGKDLTEPPYINRLSEQLPSKKSIGAKALEYMTGERIYIDSGTTTLCMAEQIPCSSPHVFITNGINIASELIARRSKSVIIIGGDLYSNSLATRGSLAEKQFNDLRVDIAFLGCNAISPEGDILVGDAIETGVKRHAMKFAQKTYILADSSKFDKYSLISYAVAQDFDGIITDSNLADGIRARLTDSGANLIIADAGPQL